MKDNFFVEIDAKETMTAAGVHITEGSVEAKKTGRILECGPDVKQPLAPGVRVMWAFPPQAPVKIDGREYVLMNQSDIVAVMIEQGE